MTLTSGTRFGPYEIVAALGAGGMGEVYRARDTRLDRDVAIKILPDAFAADADRVARFQREAKTLAALNHSNIATIHGLEQAGDVHALVMELVPGDDLSQRIARGAIPVDEALPIAKQIAEALEAAHEQGVVHRDLKPANIKVRPDGTVKVLDFGLAKLASRELSGVDHGGSLTLSPTITSPALMTGAGMILGTAAYMSPEQARGTAVDKRADIWAFGVVLFEMLTGQRPFAGDTISDTLASVLKTAPNWPALPAAVPPRLRSLLRRCLEKDPKRRLRDIGDARVLIEDLLSGVPEESATAVSAGAAPFWRRALPWASMATLLLAVLLMVMAALAFRRAGNVTPPAAPVQFTIVPPENTSFGGPPPGGGTGVATQLAVSPDGLNVVYVAGVRPGYQLWLRPVAGLAARPLAGTEGATFPFWSPDGRFIGFFADGKLKKVPIDGGDATVLCDAPYGRGGSWSRDNVILFTPGGITGLQRVSSSGGVPVEVTTPDEAGGETTHRWPHFLPDGRHFFYTAITGAGGLGSKPSSVKIGSLDSADVAVTLFTAESSVTYASGYLLFARERTLMAQPFDPDLRQPTGDAFPVAEHVSREGSRYVGAAASTNGTLVYARDDTLTPTQLTWFDRAGQALGTVSDAASFIDIALSPDERFVAVALGSGSPENVDIWIVDIARNARSRLTTDPGIDRAPIWSPDGSRVVFERSQSGKASLRQQRVDGTAAGEPLLDVSSTPSRPCDIAKGVGCGVRPTAWSADGRYVAYTLTGSFPLTSDVLVLPLSGDRKVFPIAQTSFLEELGRFSPDGRWIAYSTTEDGQSNVYVQPFPPTGRKYPVSRNGGAEPVWRADGKELFYVAAGGTLTAVQTRVAGEFAAGAPQTLFRIGAPVRGLYSQTYAVTKEGNRFLVNARPPQSSVAPITVVVNWTATIHK